MNKRKTTPTIAEHIVLSHLWDRDKNSVNPEDVTTGSSTKYIWKCSECGENYSARANNVLHSTGLCPKCAYKRGAEKRIAKRLASGEKKSIAGIPFLFDRWEKKENPENPNEISYKSNLKFYWRCSQCGTTFRRSAARMMYGSGLCTDCARGNALEKIKTTKLSKSKPITELPELVAHWDFERNEIEPDSLSFASNKKAFWICPQCKQSFSRTVNNQYQSTYLCEEFAKKLRHENHRKHMAKYKDDVIASFPNMMAVWDWEKNTRSPYDLSARSGIYVYWKCPDCGKSWKAKPCDRIKMLPHCMECSMRAHNDRRNKKAIEKDGTWGENYPKLAKQWHPTLNGDVTPFDITPNCCKPYWFLCEYGHAYKVAPRERSHRHAGCPICNQSRNTSFSEKLVAFYMSKVIDVEANYKIMGHSELDIYLPKLNVGIEYDGEFWHKFRKSKDRETRKDAYCQENNIRLIRIKESTICGQEGDIIYFIPKDENCQWLIDTLCDALSLPHIEVNVIEETPAILDLQNKVRTETSLAIKRPDALEYWDYEKNAPITPDRIGYTSCHVFSWICPECGNEFRDKVSAVTHRTHICKECGKKKKGENISKAKKKSKADKID